MLLYGTHLDSAARTAVDRAGGTITETNTRVGYDDVRTRAPGFASAMTASGAVVGVARERSIGTVVTSRPVTKQQIERVVAGQRDARARTRSDARQGRRSAAVTPESLAGLQWDMRQIGATATGSYARSTGSRKVRVGVIDTGIDGTHPDIAPNFSSRLSRNFVTDMPDIDGPCEHPSCVDPADEDDDGHGTHVASTIGSPINGLGIAGVAPSVTLVDIRAGQDSGYFFLEPTLRALTYAGTIGVDVVNMSFYTDPWLFNCVADPADSPEEQQQQRVIRQATQRAIPCAMHRGVLPVAAKDRTIDNSCITVPTETRGVVAVSST